MTKVKMTWPQIVVFQGLNLEEKDRPNMIAWMASEEMGGARLEYLDEYSTLPDRVKRTGEVIPNTGGRTDVMFRIDPDSIAKYAAARFGHGDMTGRWWEDVVTSCSGIIPPQIQSKYPTTW